MPIALLDARQLTKSYEPKAGNGSKYTQGIMLVKGLLPLLIIVANAGNLQLVSSNENDSLEADFYNETTISRIAFGSCR